MASKLPCIIPKSIDCSGIFVNDYRKFFVKEEIGQGSFSSVYTANVPSDAGHGEKVLIKKLLRQDVEIKKFVKEARMLQIWKHANIVILKGIGNAPFALVMEYVFFDFAPFGGRNKVSSLEGLYLMWTALISRFWQCAFVHCLAPGVSARQNASSQIHETCEHLGGQPPLS